MNFIERVSKSKVKKPERFPVRLDLSCRLRGRGFSLGSVPRKPVRFGILCIMSCIKRVSRGKVKT